MTSEITSIKLLKQEDWPAWFYFIKNEAIAAEIWAFVNPGDETPPNNEKPDLHYYIRDRPSTIPPPNPPADPQPNPPQPEPPANPDLEKLLAGLDSAGRWNVYKVDMAQYEKNQKNLVTLSRLIITTVGPNFLSYLFDEHNPHKLLQTLQRLAKPSMEALRQAIRADIERLDTGPKRLGVEAWLNLYVTIAQKGKQIDNPPYEATSPYLIKHLIQSSNTVNPKFYTGYGQQADEGKLVSTLEEMIEMFNLSYKPSKGYRAAFPTLAGEPLDTQTDESKRKDCAACGGRHNVKKCRNLFEEIRPDGWVVNERQERRCQEYLKTPEGKALYQEQKKHFAANPPAKPTLQTTHAKRKASQEPDSPGLSAAAAFIPTGTGAGKIHQN